jgi:hypothetical protein
VITQLCNLKCLLSHWYIVCPAHLQTNSLRELFQAVEIVRHLPACPALWLIQGTVSFHVTQALYFPHSITQPSDSTRCSQLGLSSLNFVGETRKQAPFKLARLHHALDQIIAD